VDADAGLLLIVPGSSLVTFIVSLAGRASAFTVRPSRFLDGLRAARDLMSFAELHREDERLDELLPWAGNV
jgi:hypothetical protein